jgi:hypothetical protein
VSDPAGRRSVLIAVLEPSATRRLPARKWGDTANSYTLSEEPFIITKREPGLDVGLFGFASRRHIQQNERPRKQLRLRLQVCQVQHVLLTVCMAATCCDQTTGDVTCITSGGAKELHTGLHQHNVTHSPHPKATIQRLPLRV